MTARLDQNCAENRESASAAMISLVCPFARVKSPGRTVPLDAGRRRLSADAASASLAARRGCGRASDSGFKSRLPGRLRLSQHHGGGNGYSDAVLGGPQLADRALKARPVDPDSVNDSQHCQRRSNLNPRHWHIVAVCQ